MKDLNKIFRSSLKFSLFKDHFFIFLVMVHSLITDFQLDKYRLALKGNKWIERRYVMEQCLSQDIWHRALLADAAR